MSVLESVAPTDVRGSQRPGLLHLPDGSDAHISDALYLCGEWGFGFDPAQEFVLGASLREQPDTRWACKEIGLEEPRQNGKGEIIEGREALGLFYLDERELIHSAHEFATASAALDRMDERIRSNPLLKRRVKSIKRSHGEQGVYLHDGRKLLYKTRTKGAGRGFSADLLILDEAMYIAKTFLAALMPVISARPNPQMWYTGSAVDQNTMEDGVVFARLRERALERKPGRMAYFGWSAAYDNNEVLWRTPTDVPADVTRDPAVIARANPALGIRIDLEHVMETEHQAMDHDTFCVERLGVGDWPSLKTDGDVVSVKRWLDLRDPSSTATDPVVFAFDMTPERTAGAIGVAGRRLDGLGHVEIVEHRPGTDWIVDAVVALADAQAAEVLVDGKSPAASLVDDIQNRGVKVRRVTAVEHAEAFGAFFDAIQNAGLRHLGTPELQAAIKGAGRRQLVDAWAWSRKNSTVDISPLVAVTLAWWRRNQIGDGGDFVASFSDDELAATAAEMGF